MQQTLCSSSELVKTFSLVAGFPQDMDIRGNVGGGGGGEMTLVFQSGKYQGILQFTYVSGENYGDLSFLNIKEKIMF